MDSKIMMEKYLVKPAIAGAIGYTLSSVYIGKSLNIPVLGGFTMSAPAALGGACFAGEIVGSVIADQVIDNMDASDNEEESITMLIKPAVTAISVLGMTFAIAGDVGSISAQGKVFGLGVAATIGSDYAYNMLMPSGF